MSGMVPVQDVVREGRDAVIAAFREGVQPPRCPYTAASKRRLFWQVGADKARAAIDQLMRIGE